jgi:MurNAc alpha-1-phosphate uridylyltransferase
MRLHEDLSAGDQRFTFSGISVMHKNLFAGLPIEPSSMVPLLQEAMLGNKVSGEVHSGLWMDIGTPERLQEVNLLVAEGSGD